MIDPPVDLRDASLPAGVVARGLRLSPHPEGGHFRETWRDAAPEGGRGVGTAILFLLASGERSRWHRVDAAELWSWHAGAPLRLGIAEHGAVRSVLLGPEAAAGEVLQAVVPAGLWQDAESLGRWTLTGCVVMPAFSFSGFEMAPPGFDPGGEGSDG